MTRTQNHQKSIISPLRASAGHTGQMGSHAFPIRTVAREAGVSGATVDRVLNGRGGVRAITVARVRRAIAELERRQEAFELGGRTFTLDLVMQAPRRFTSAVWDAFEHAIPAAHPAAFVMRPHLSERVDPAGIVTVLDTIAERGTHAVVLKAPDAPEVVAAVDRLVDLGVAVITIVTDLPTSRRQAYVGLDNRAAGATAAYLIDQWRPALNATPPTRVLLAVSSERFAGEEQRVDGFRSTAGRIGPEWTIVQLSETEGLDTVISAQRDDLEAIAASGPVDAVYSIGGGNRALLDGLAGHDNQPPVFIAHDLDGDNRRLLSAGAISAVLHHDLRADAARALRLVMQVHHAVPGTPTTESAPVHVITPYNIPALSIG